MKRAPLAVVVELGRDIKLAHSVFALPFAVLAMFMACAWQVERAGGLPRKGEAVLVVACMVLARTYAMLANRYVDRSIDARNPRTAGRALPAGRVSVATVRWAILLAGAGLVAAAAGFGLMYGNWWPVAASPVVLAWLGAYGYFKRFTALSHFFLGGALGLSPLAAALAVEPGYLTRPGAWLLAGFVLLWVGGFDIIYAMQDEDFDRREGLHSIPAHLGRYPALWVARLAHYLGLALLVVLQRQELAFRSHVIVPGTGQMTGFAVAILVVALLLIIEHRAAARGHFHVAFFSVNGLVAMALGGLGIWDVVATLKL